MLFDPQPAMVPDAVEHSQDELFSAIVASFGEAVISQDLEGRISAWNAAAEKLVGYTAEEALGRPFILVAPDLTPRNLGSFLQRLQLGEAAEECETYFHTKGGSILEVTLSISLLETRSRRPLGSCVSVKHVISEGRNKRDLAVLDAELREGEHRFRILSETLADMLWATDALNPAARYVSPRFSEYTGLSVESMTKQTWKHLLHPEDHDATENVWLQAQAGQQRFKVEFRLRRFDGIYRWFVGRGTPVHNDQGEIVQWVGTCTDIDDLKRSEEALRRSNKELKQFAYAAAHDLQEPLRNVATSVGMLRRHYEPTLDPSGMEWVDASIEGAHRLYAMVKDLLTFSTIIDDEIDNPGDACVWMHSAVEGALTELSSEVQFAGPDIRFADLPRISVQRNHAVRLFQNLIGNSLKYRRSDVRPTIEISAIPLGTEWTISVKDNGIGFDPVYATKIFGVFKRLHGREAYPGNGIGLAVCERIVAHYGGRIWAQATPGQGATFQFTLPGVPEK